MMSEMLVSFKNPEEILNFVNTVAKYPYDMDMKRGRFVVDAKSILGIMNLGLNNVISLQVYGDHCEELKKEIFSVYKEIENRRNEDREIFFNTFVRLSVL